MAGISLFLSHKRLSLRATSGALASSSLSGTNATLKTDRAHSRALARHSTAKNFFHRPKSHYTAPACGFWIIKIFQFYFSSNQTARPRQCWRLCGKPKLKRLKRISVFFILEDQINKYNLFMSLILKGIIFFLFVGRIVRKKNVRKLKNPPNQ